MVQFFNKEVWQGKKGTICMLVRLLGSQNADRSSSATLKSLIPLFPPLVARDQNVALFRGDMVKAEYS